MAKLKGLDITMPYSKMMQPCISFYKIFRRRSLYDSVLTNFDVARTSTFLLNLIEHILGDGFNNFA